jgi:hypothetical protein
VIATRLPVADIADHESTSALRRELEQLSSDAGSKLLRALGVEGHEAQLRRASDEFRGRCLALTLLGKAEALHLADRTSEALEAINEAEALAERFEQRFCCAELHRLRGVFLAASGADEARIEASFCKAISTAQEQKSISLAKRAEATYAEYRRQKASRSGRRGFRISLCQRNSLAKKATGCTCIRVFLRLAPQICHSRPL